MASTHRAVLLVASLGLACATAPPTPRSNPLGGTWVGASDNALGTQIVFASGGRATWRLGDDFAVQYRVDSQAGPKRLDLYGFDRGPLAGRTLLCVYDLSTAGELHLDCEPSRPDADAESVRPKAFDPAQTQIFRRAP